MGIPTFLTLHLHLNRKNLYSQELTWNLAGGGTIRSVAVTQHGEKNYNSIISIVSYSRFSLCTCCYQLTCVELLWGLLLFVDLHNWIQQHVTQVFMSYLGFPSLTHTVYCLYCLYWVSLSIVSLNANSSLLHLL